ncbi:carotenoid cleavage dioxygenase-like enzyme [Mycobacteroides chelonae]|nr:carotenoid cleavage dioxygenase-like enzyme [Mycobacteroides chelonae]
MRIALVPHDGGPHRIVECDPLVYVHVDNAYEDHGELHILDAAAIEDPALTIAVLPGHRFPGFHGSVTDRI